MIQLEKAVPGPLTAGDFFLGFMVFAICFGVIECSVRATTDNISSIDEEDGRRVVVLGGEILETIRHGVANDSLKQAYIKFYDVELPETVSGFKFFLNKRDAVVSTSSRDLHYVTEIRFPSKKKRDFIIDIKEVILRLNKNKVLNTSKALELVVVILPSRKLSKEEMGEIKINLSDLRIFTVVSYEQKGTLFFTEAGCMTL